jgi:hypothetical protein
MLAEVAESHLPDRCEDATPRFLIAKFGEPCGKRGGLANFDHCREV